jgi:pimeloyl-ACP methyl ester carboxylesterase
MVTKKALIDGTELFYVDQGDGQAFVLVHGGISDYRIWDAHRPSIAQRYRVIAPTQRYFGLRLGPTTGGTTRYKPMPTTWLPSSARCDWSPRLVLWRGGHPGHGGTATQTRGAPVPL